MTEGPSYNSRDISHGFRLFYETQYETDALELATTILLCA